VKSLTPGGPAADSQLKVDDQLLSVNGHDVAGKSIAQVKFMSRRARDTLRSCQSLRGLFDTHFVMPLFVCR
jgi:C-terminal processing protease CtpA/Prc